MGFEVQHGSNRLRPPVHNQVLQFDITLGPGASAATAPAVWSDSWQSGQNFDPIAALWRPLGADFSLHSEVDDDDSVAPGQGFYDTGFKLGGFAAGRYRLTLGAAPNTAQGTLLSEGFVLDADAPIALADWSQPSFDANANDQKGNVWRLHFSGVDQVSAVPEPGAWMLLLVGGAGLLAWQRRLRQASTMPACNDVNSSPAG